jgi:hypothetical protein
MGFNLKMNLKFKLSIWLAIPLFLSGCLLSQPSMPALVAAAAPNPNTPPSIQGKLLDECLFDARGDAFLGQGTVAAYDPRMTLSFMQFMSIGHRNREEVAPRIRIYIAKVAFLKTTRPIYFSVACVMDLKNNSMGYLSSFEFQDENRINKGSVESALIKGYPKMIGVDPLKYFLFGELAR